jgi:hypothetical protein
MTADNGEKSQQQRADANDDYDRAKNEGEDRREICRVPDSFRHDLE